MLADLVRKGFWAQFLFLLDRVCFVYGVHCRNEMINELMNMCNEDKTSNFDDNVSEPNSDFD